MSISFALVAPVDDMAALPISCPLCCEDKPMSGMVLLSKCSHESCKDCITKWIEKTEASGHQMTQPTCPFCRLELTEEETFAILGRSFQPASTNSSTPTEVEVDELTLQWLQEQTRPCPHCGALIEKEEGCDLMECLCGFRFCYGCGSQGAQCSCTPDNHVFYDNIIGRNAGRGAQEGAAVDEQTGLVDLLAHIERRKREERAAQVRGERERRRDDEEWERMEAEDDGFTLSSKWLFCTSSQKGLRVLQQQMRADIVRDARRGQRRTEERERRMIHEAISNGAWLFQIKSSTGVERFLSRQIVAFNRRIARQNRRNNRRTESDVEAVITNGRWLFKKKGHTETLELLAKLVKNEEKSRKGSWDSSSFFGRFQLGGCGRPGCLGCGGVSSRGDEVKDNAISIRLLFLNEEEGIRERAEIDRNGL